MATKKHTVKGLAQWARVFDSNKEMKDYQGNPYDFGGLFKIDVILDKENKAIYKSSGTSGKGKFNDEGQFLATFKRKENERFEWAGGPPKVLNVDGSVFEGSLIPNNSEVEVDFTVYSTSMSPGTRLESVKILKLAEMPERKEEQESKEDPPKVETKVKDNTTIPF